LTGTSVRIDDAYLAFECEALSTAETRGVSIRIRKIRRARSVLTLAIFLASMLISLRFPLCGFGLICRGRGRGISPKVASPKATFVRRTALARAWAPAPQGKTGALARCLQFSATGEGARGTFYGAEIGQTPGVGLTQHLFGLGKLQSVTTKGALRGSQLVADQGAARPPGRAVMQ
jgi:hypothetical protein